MQNDNFIKVCGSQLEARSRTLITLLQIFHKNIENYWCLRSFIQEKTLIVLWHKTVQNTLLTIFF